MIPFPFNGNRFSFFVTNHLQVSLLCTNPKSDRSLLSCLKVIQCSTSKIGDAPLYNSCSLLIQIMTRGQLSARSKWKSGRLNVPRVLQTKFPATVMVFDVVSSEGHIMPPHIFEVGLKVNTKVYLDVLKSVMIPWCNQVAGGGPWVWKQALAPAHKSKEIQAWLQKECYDFVPFSHCIRWAPAGACGKGMLLVPDPYRGCNWGWRRLHWIDVSSLLHNQATWIVFFFNKSFKIKL